MIFLRILLALALLTGSAQAQMNSFFPGPGAPAASAPAYQGPGDIVASAKAWGSCARVYTAAQASTSTSLCDLVAVTGGAAVCTLRATASGFVDLAASYCAGTTPAAACAAASGGSCKVSKVYDQTGGGYHPVQATLASMPALTFSAVGGLPCTTYAGAQSLVSASSFSGTQPQTYSAVALRSTVQFGGIVGLDVSGHVGLFGTGTTDTWAGYAGSVASFTATDNAYHAVQFIINGASSASYLDGSSTTGLTAGSQSSGSFSFGLQNGAFFAGSICEGGWWDNNAFSLGNQSAMNANQHSSTSGYNF